MKRRLNNHLYYFTVEDESLLGETFPRFEEDTYAYQAGAGIVADSSPESEYQEVRNKVAALEAALRLVDEGL